MRPQAGPHSLSESCIQMSGSIHQWTWTVVLHRHHDRLVESAFAPHYRTYLDASTLLGSESNDGTCVS